VHSVQVLLLPRRREVNLPISYLQRQRRKNKREKSLSLARAFNEWMIMYLSLYNRYIYLFTYPIIICVTFCPILCDILSVETGQN